MRDDQYHDDRPFIVLAETKPSKRHIPVWARYSPLPNNRSLSLCLRVCILDEGVHLGLLLRIDPQTQSSNKQQFRGQPQGYPCACRPSATPRNASTSEVHPSGVYPDDGDVFYLFSCSSS
jgi:hypothetical protein